METYKEKGYLHNEFKIFHLSDTHMHQFDYHYHTFNKIIIFLKGDVIYHIEGNSYKLLPNDIILISAGEIHKPVINLTSTYERIIIYISQNFINDFKTDNYDLNYCFSQSISNKSHVIRLNQLENSNIDQLKNSRLFDVICELEQSFSITAYANDLYHRILFLEFMILLNRATIDQDISYVVTANNNALLKNILNYVNLNITQELTVDSIAKEFFISRYYLMHQFKQETGCTLGNYITNKRLYLAHSLIKNGTPITQACYESGFKNYSTFSRAYKKHFNMSPKKNTTSYTQN